MMCHRWCTQMDFHQTKDTTMLSLGNATNLAPGDVRLGHMTLAPLRINLMAPLSTCCCGNMKGSAWRQCCHTSNIVKIHHSNFYMPFNLRYPSPDLKPDLKHNPYPNSNPHLKYNPYPNSNPHLKLNPYPNSNLTSN